MPKSLACAVLSAMLVAGALGPSADAAKPLVILLHGYQSYGGNPDYNLTVWAEVFLGADRADLDAIEVTLRYDGANITASRSGLGTYQIDITYPPNVGPNLVYFVTVNGTLGPQAATRDILVALRPEPPYPSAGWGLEVTSIDPVDVVPGPVWLSPRQASGGGTVVIEGRTSHNGTPADPSVMTATLQCADGISDQFQYDPDPQGLTVTRVDVGVYRASFVAPEPGIVTKRCRGNFFMWIRDENTGTTGDGSSVDFTVAPFPVYVWSSTGDYGTATYRVLAGGSAPVAGAKVELRAEIRGRSWPDGNWTTFSVSDSAVTDNSGYAEVHFLLNASGDTDLWVNVTADGRTASVVILGNAHLYDGAAIPFQEPALPNTTLYAGFRSPWPAGVPWNTSANYTMVAGSGGVPLANETLYAYLRTGYDGPVLGAFEVTTDAAGAFTLPVPLTYATLGGAFAVVVASEGRGDTSAYGEAPRLIEPFQRWEAHGAPNANLSAEVTSNRTTSGFDLRVEYTGDGLPADARGWVIATPANESGECELAYGHGAAPWGTLTPTTDPSVFQGRVALPGWYPSGPYCLYVRVGNDTWWSTTSSSVIVQEAVPDPAPPAPPPGEGPSVFSAFFDAGVWLIALIILATVTTAAAIRARRRRGQDEEHEPLG